jgi:hypothetical protein
MLPVLGMPVTVVDVVDVVAMRNGGVPTVRAVHMWVGAGHVVPERVQWREGFTHPLAAPEQ